MNAQICPQTGPDKIRRIHRRQSGRRSGTAGAVRTDDLVIGTGRYQGLAFTNRQYAYARSADGDTAGEIERGYYE